MLEHDRSEELRCAKEDEQRGPAPGRCAQRETHSRIKSDRMRKGFVHVCVHAFVYKTQQGLQGASTSAKEVLRPGAES